MTTSISNLKTEGPAYDIQNVQGLVSQSATKVLQALTLSVMVGLQEQLNFAQLGQKHINAQLLEDIEKVDVKLQRVYHKLFAVVNSAVPQSSQNVLVPVLAQIKISIESPKDADQLYVGNFVFQESKKLLQLLETREPASLEDNLIWT